MKRSSFIRLLLLVSGAIFFAVQFKMFFSHIQCSEKVSELRNSNDALLHRLNILRLNLTYLYSEKNNLRSEIISSEDNLKDLQRSYENKIRSLEEAIRIKEENLKSAVKKIEEIKNYKINSEKNLNDTNNKIRVSNAKPEITTQTKQQPTEDAVKLSQNQIKEIRIKQQIKDTDKYRNFVNLIHNPKSLVAAVVIMSCNRPDYLKKTITSILRQHNSPSKFPLFISQDGTNEEVKLLAKTYPQFIYMQHIEKSAPVPDSPNENIAYYRIANHYKWAFTQLFDIQGMPRVIILEDDMEISVDFFDYFEATSSILDIDETLLAVSSWNDNGQSQFVKDPEAVYRSDFFPGLGWMLKKETWNELSPKWPKAYWDDWLRLKVNRKGRATIFPEVCRNYNFGEHGSSFGQFFQKHLFPIKLNDVKVPWIKRDLSFLLEPFYSQNLRDQIDNATVMSAETFLEANMASIDQSHSGNSSNNVVLVYDSQQSFTSIASAFGIFEEWKDGIPRTAFKGVVFFRYKGWRKFFVVAKSTALDLHLKRPLA